MNELVRIESNVEAYRASTEAADLCKEIVVATSSMIQGRRYVSVEGWQAIARAHGCAAGARDVKRVDGGVSAIGEVRDIHTGALVATAEGFVGEDETTWYGGKDKRGKIHEKRNDYAIRAMAQTRAMSRACRSAFAHVVVMMKAGLATTPAEEVPANGFDPDTGEIIEAVKEPAAREVLDGPFTSKTALRKAVIDLITAVRKAETLEAVDMLKATNRRTINQALRDWPSLIDGDPNIPEDIGLKGAIELRRGELTPVEESETYTMCMETLDACTSSKELDGWFKLNWRFVDELDGAERDRVENRYQELEMSLKAIDNVSAG